MALGTIPPWLDVRPEQFVRAAASGAEAGISAARAAAAESEAADRLRLAYATLESQERRADEAAQAKLQAAQAALDLRAQQMESLDAYRQGRLAQMGDIAAGRQDLASATLAERTRHNIATEEISEAKAREMIARGVGKAVQIPELPGKWFIQQPSGTLTPVSPEFKAPTVVTDAAGVPLSYSGQLTSPIMQGIMGTNAPPALGMTNAPVVPRGTPAPAPAGPGILERAGQLLKLTPPAVIGSQLFGGEDTGGITPVLPGAGTAPAAKPMPSRKEDLVEGEIYETRRGPARWDGSQFVKD